MSSGQSDMKLRVARTLKWNVVDRVATQLLYAVTGVILARELSQDDFGLVGAVLIFQSFASLFIDSGFSSALIQKKTPSRLDYSTVMWFNMAMAAVIYIAMYFAAPLVADCFDGDRRLIPLTRVMFLVSILNASCAVLVNRLMKKMDVRMVAVSNSLGLFAGAVVGIWMAVSGYGAWALVWQYITLAGVKSLVLWATSRWLPLMSFSVASLRSFFRVGSGIMGATFLNLIFQNIYSFIIGNRAGLTSLGYYTQADKWSKMPVASLSAVLTQSFLPVLSQYQDSPQNFASSTAKMNRLTAYLTFPSMAMLMVLATPIFHVLFGSKWDPSIPLFQLLCLRGIFTILAALYNNYVVALGRSRLMIVTEIVRDGTALVAIAATLPFITLGNPADITRGLVIFLWGQVAAAVLAWAVTLVIAARISWRSAGQYLADLLPYAAESIAICAALIAISPLIANPWLLIAAQTALGATLYLGINALLGSAIQRNAIAYITHRLK